MSIEQEIVRGKSSGSQPTVSRESRPPRPKSSVLSDRRDAVASSKFWPEQWASRCVAGLRRARVPMDGRADASARSRTLSRDGAPVHARAGRRHRRGSPRLSTDRVSTESTEQEARPRSYVRGSSADSTCRRRNWRRLVAARSRRHHGGPARSWPPCSTEPLRIGSGTSHQLVVRLWALRVRHRSSMVSRYWTASRGHAGVTTTPSACHLSTRRCSPRSRRLLTEARCRS